MPRPTFLLLAAVLGNVVPQITFVNGLRLTTAGHSALWLGLAPGMVALANRPRGNPEDRSDGTDGAA